MDRHAVLLVTILLCYHLLFDDVVTSTRNLSKEDDVMEIDIKLLNKTLQVGTLPILRISKTDHSRETEFSKAPITETKYSRPNTYLAVARTKYGSGKYSGAGSYIKVDNPKMAGQQYSATRIRLQSGTDSIEAGWRVDPSLYGDSRARLYIRTDAGHTHCFNTRCPGFIQTFHGINFDVPIENISIPGGRHMYLERIYIIKDFGSGNWNLFIEENTPLIGYWPSRIFTKLANLADRVEWGGVAYSPPGTPLPPMGSGNFPVGDLAWDAAICNMKVLNEKGQTDDPSGIEIYADNSNFYSVRLIGYVSESLGYVILYGGPGH